MHVVAKLEAPRTLVLDVNSSLPDGATVWLDITRFFFQRNRQSEYVGSIYERKDSELTGGKGHFAIPLSDAEWFNGYGDLVRKDPADFRPIARISPKINVEVRFDPTEQSDKVQEAVGKRGELLVGALRKKVGNVTALIFETAITLPFNADTPVFSGSTTSVAYKILKLRRAENVNCVADIQVPHELSSQEVLQVAEVIRGRECSGLIPVIIGFYLPGMVVDTGSWASAVYDPTLWGPAFKVHISGLTRDAVAGFATTKLPPGQELVGRWRDDRIGCIITIVRERGRYFDDVSSNPSLSGGRRELKESFSKQGRQFTPIENDFGEYYVISPDGSLKEYDRKGLITTAPKL
jgi:hypothetical protein